MPRIALTHGNPKTRREPVPTTGVIEVNGQTFSNGLDDGDGFGRARKGDDRTGTTDSTNEVI
ncbi:hypothetical protein AC480_03105 [miscellaneous Crenarchaeota group archaeon SMTZ1-55]|nr:MAG: hypothetical protein AC480_03105 [miscellaneous Crenarchaeota group archaeon SMTZ1-55]